MIDAPGPPGPAVPRRLPMRRALIAACLCAAAAAQQAPGSAGEAQTAAALAQAAAEAQGSVMHGTVGGGFTSAYFFRGMLQEIQGAVAEPYLGLDMPVWQSPGVLRALDLTLGQSNSLHDGPTGTADPQSMWSQHDLFVGLQAHLDETWTVGRVYNAYYSPDRQFDTVQEVAFSLAYDDRAHGDWLAWLQPSALVAFETSGQSDAVGSSGVYGELALAPELGLGDVGGYDVTLALPVRLGLSLGDYYEAPGGGDSTFGYLDLGCVLCAPLAFLPRRLGPWQGTLGCHVLLLGDSNELRNDGDAVEWLVTCGFSTTF